MKYYIPWSSKKERKKWENSIFMFPDKNKKNSTYIDDVFYYLSLFSKYIQAL